MAKSLMLPAVMNTCFVFLFPSTTAALIRVIVVEGF